MSQNTDVFDVINAAVAFVNAGGLDDEMGGSPKGEVTIAGLQQVIVGGFDETNFTY